MYAVMETGGKQYRVAPGDTIHVETLAGEAGTPIELGGLLAVVDDSNRVLTGAQIAGARLKATITGHGRGDKILVFKFRRKKQYKRTIGHRQNYTALKVDQIVAPTGAAPA